MNGLTASVNDQVVLELNDSDDMIMMDYDAPGLSNFNYVDETKQDPEEPLSFQGIASFSNNASTLCVASGSEMHRINKGDTVTYQNDMWIVQEFNPKRMSAVIRNRNFIKTVEVFVLRLLNDKLDSAAIPLDSLIDDHRILREATKLHVMNLDQ